MERTINDAYNKKTNMIVNMIVSRNGRQISTQLHIINDRI